MKFQDPDWRFESPGPLSDGAYHHFLAWAKRIASQGLVQDILEDFKWRFSHGGTARSSSANWAEHDLANLMQAAAKNAPLFIDAFVSACADLKGQGVEVPSVRAINRALHTCREGYQIEGDVLVAKLWVPDGDEADLDALIETPGLTTNPTATTPRRRADATNMRASRPAPNPTAPREPRLRVFLCHSSGDKAAVKDLYGFLRLQGYDPWLDAVNLVPGQDWEAEIRKAVKTSHVVVVCLSKGSTTKAGFVQKEIRIALDVADEQPEGRIFLIPSRLEDVDVPARLSKWHRVDLFDDGGNEQLLGALSLRASQM